MKPKQEGFNIYKLSFQNIAAIQTADTVSFLYPQLELPVVLRSPESQIAVWLAPKSTLDSVIWTRWEIRDVPDRPLFMTLKLKTPLSDETHQMLLDLDLDFTYQKRLGELTLCDSSICRLFYVLRGIEDIILHKKIVLREHDEFFQGVTDKEYKYLLRLYRQKKTPSQKIILKYLPFFFYCASVIQL